MSATLEREIKLSFASVEAARAAVLAIGATPLHGRRLQEDCLLDTTNDDLRRRRSALRVRQDGGRCLLTFKGPVQPASVKVREEIETPVGDGTQLMKILGELGFHVWFRYEKYREEFALDDCILAIDETPVGIFVSDATVKQKAWNEGSAGLCNSGQTLLRATGLVLVAVS